MKIKPFLVLILFTAFTFSFTSDRPAYELYSEKGKKTNYKALLKKIEKADVVFFGELHDNPIAHWLQKEVTQDMHGFFGDQLVLGAEMYESDDQLIINEYLAGKYPFKSFKPEMKLWSNNATDYQPLLDFAKDNELNFIATNVPRRYANLVYRQGFEGLDSLSDEAKKWIAPLPIPYDPSLASYQAMIEMMGGHASDNFPKAQAIKDATMAHFINTNLGADQKFLHYNGSFHSDDYEGIVWFLKKLRPELNVVVITTVEQDSINSLEEEYHHKADFIICVPANMTKTY